MKCGKLSLRRFFSCFVPALPALLLMCGGMLLWPQDREPSSRNSEEHLKVWETLSSKFAADLQAHEETLKELGRKLQTSEANLGQLTPLYDLSLRQNESLKEYNSQVVQRMQERDEDLVSAYEVITGKDKAILRLVIAIILLSIPYIVKLALWVAKKF
jgi:hypothetical protein